ncbi:type VI secretion system membrane subunit TssM [Alsobacter sp. KACC 23698]|uniref:Type VI secretion system membrane subunit TssM n=1 Tax=Alsobacter sp. KACC 23698 TaxID=3149229 RepID=A0AAU7JMM2_9HYPH
MFNKDALGKDVFRIILYGVGLGSISAMIYLAGPYVEFGGWRPLENHIVREIVIVVLVAAFAAFSGVKLWRRKANAAALGEGIAAEAVEDDAEELSGRMKDALATLKQASGGKADFLYELPWYVIIGPPGSGKTTALVNSGLKFPLAGKSTPSAIAGVGGTRYCDWWFTEDAVLIDTAGRYTTQDSDVRSDKQSWLSFLDILKKNRPRQPINGVIVAISLHDVLSLDPDELAAHAKAIRARLLELHDRLKVDFPVYALFTKCDLVAGFTEYFGDLGEQARRQVWGATFQTNDKTKNLVSNVPDEYDALIERLNLDMPDRLQDEPAPATRAALYGFPAQMAALKRPVYAFLNAVFEPTRYHVNATLRGFYFTSGTQQGTPIDQLIVALSKNFGAQEIAGNAFSGLGKSYFLSDLIQNVIIGEAAWVSTDPRAVRRARILKAMAFAAIALVAAAAAGAWWVSWNRNVSLIAATDGAGKEFAAAGGPIPREEVVADRDFSKILPLLQKLRHMPTGFAQRDAPVPVAATFGLSQWERLESSSVSAYRLALERMLRPRLLYRLEEVLEQRASDPGYVYEALKVYMMLGGLHAADRELVLSWERQDWADALYPGPAQAEGRKALEDHLNAMLDLEPGHQPLVQVSGAVVAESQRTLARLSVAQRAYELLKSQARSLNIPDWSAARAGGPDFERVFEAAGGAPVETLRTPGFFTYAGFQRAFMARLPDIADRINKERWVLGEFGEQSSVADQYKTLPNDLLALYGKEFVATWRAVLARITVRRLTADKPRYLALTAAAAANSPLKALFESIRDETALTRERPGAKPADAGAAQPAAASLVTGQDQPPGAAIEAQFRPFHAWVETVGSRRQIDELVAQLSDIRDNLITSANVPGQSPQANAALQSQVQRFRSSANQLPDPFKDQLMRVASAFQTDVVNSELGQLARALGDQVTGACQQVVNGRYPFTRGVANEIALSDFGRVFGQGGVMDRFFQTFLQKYADTSKPTWAWRADQPLTGSLSPGLLREFQRAQQIRETFFSGGPQPQIAMTVYPPILSGSGVTAKFEMNGQVVTAQAGVAGSPQAMSWPAGGGRTAVLLSYDAPASTLLGGAQPAPSAPAVLERSGAWSLFRLLDAGAPVQKGERLVASFIVGGRELQYQFSFGSRQNPYSLAALREFRCPAGI